MRRLARWWFVVRQLQIEIDQLHVQLAQIKRERDAYKELLNITIGIAERNGDLLGEQELKAAEPENRLPI